MRSLHAKILGLVVLFTYAGFPNCQCQQNQNENSELHIKEIEEKVEMNLLEDMCAECGEENKNKNEVVIEIYADSNCAEESNLRKNNNEDGLQIESISITVLEDRVVSALYNYSKTGVVTPQLNKDLGKIQKLKSQYRQSPDKQSSDQKQVELKEFTFCTLCKIGAKILLTYRQIGGPKDFASLALKMLCYQFEPKRVCDGLIDLNIDILIYIIDNKPDTTPSIICSIIAQPYNCKDTDHDNSWKIYLPPRVSTNPKIITKTSEKSIKPLRILHVTDIHYDYKYRAGANAKCGEPLCCGVDQGNPESPEYAAGTWGDYRTCDMPFHAVENLMDAASKHEVDLIYHTGDIINHRVWETSRKTNIQSILDVNELFRKKFPNKTVYHIAGNHEPNPLNEFAPEQVMQDDLSTHWLYNLLAEEWSTWLPKHTQKTIRKGGYYTVLVRPGFRIIALNSNVCYVYNWWLLYNNIDPYGQLQWLSDTLHQAELNREVVHILSHVPSGDKECYKPWSHQYNRIIRRFDDTIKAQFVGHTHNNELHFFYEENKADPINVAFNGGSFTTYIDVNPNYRIYEVNPSSYQVEDLEDWIYNVTEANQNDINVPPKWYKLYSFKETYGLSSMNLSELGKLVHSLSTDSNLLNTYFRLKVRNGDPFLKKGCDHECNEENLCSLVTTEFGDTGRCKKLLSAYRQANSL